MVAIFSSVTIKYDTSWLTRITNLENTEPTGIDVPRLTEAINDAIGEFEDTVFVTFDETDKGHVGAVSVGTICYVLGYSGRKTQNIKDW